jgi:hypothetical protein
MGDWLFQPTLRAAYEAHVEAQAHASVMNEKAQKRMAVYDAIGNYLDSDPRIRFDLMGGKQYVLPDPVPFDAYFQVESVKDE